MDYSDGTRDFEEDVEHDQLPDVQEYKASIGFGAKREKLDPDGHDGIFLLGGQPEFSIDDDGEEEESAAIVQENFHEIPRLGKYKTSQARRPWSARCWKLCALLSSLTLLVATLVIVLSTGGEESDFLHFVEGETDNYQAVREYVTEVAKLTDPSTLDVQASPQYFAAQWLAHGDGLDLEVPSRSDDQYSQRYAMAVLYFSLSGPSWVHQYKFLSADHICAWYQEFEIVTSEDENLDERFKVYGVHKCRQDEDEDDSGLVPRALSLPSNGLNGTLPSEMAALAELQFLEIEANEGLTGALPSVMRELTNLRRIMVQFCNFEGSIPTWIGELTKLNALGLGGNYFYGDVPTELGSLTTLELLGLDRNQLSGHIDLFSSMFALQSLYLDSNFFEGQITSGWMNSHPNLQELDISDNAISGSLPNTFFDDCPFLQVIDLHGNHLVGSIPPVPSENNELMFLALQQNKLDKAVNDLSNLKVLEHLDLSDNRLTGRLPGSLGLMTNLKFLFTGTNLFDKGQIPSWLSGLTNLRELSMKENSLTGNMPSSMFGYSLTNLQFLDLHYNVLTGQIPESISSLTNLRHLLLKTNRLEGTIPSTLNKLTNLEVLLLEQNLFSGDTHDICSSPDMKIQAFVSDCEGDQPEITCTCCTTCCIVGDAKCNTFEFEWKDELDVVSNYGYRRQRYGYDTTFGR